MAYTYILECVDGSYYTGSTVELVKRFNQHQAGEGAKYTSKRIPVTLVYLVYYETFDSVTGAFKREKQIQNWGHAKKKALIEGNYCDLSILAKKKFERE